jgi:hypothetical protein
MVDANGKVKFKTIYWCTKSPGKKCVTRRMSKALGTFNAMDRDNWKVWYIHPETGDEVQGRVSNLGSITFDNSFKRNDPEDPNEKSGHENVKFCIMLEGNEKCNSVNFDRYGYSDYPGIYFDFGDDKIDITGWTPNPAESQ